MNRKTIYPWYVPIFILILAGVLMSCGVTKSTSTSQRKEVRQDGKLVEIEFMLPGLAENNTPLTVVYIPAGTFMMGSPDSEPSHEENENPVHEVTISKDFFIGKYEVTQAQWLALMDENPSTEQNPNFPVNKVNWEDCQEYIKRLNAYHQTSGFRLPTEAEFEYACRAGTTTSSFFGENPSEEEMEKYVWFRNNSEGELHAVGQLQPNPWGLYDMMGNIWEWCQDWYGPYPSETQIDPKGPESGTEKVFRGPSWLGRPEWVRCADRGKFTPDNQRNTGGFRLVWQE